ncbi:DMT family transporter [Patescibacteria group bacterium]|nr:DMT family transporter [Patescibacteria group bacterium]
MFWIVLAILAHFFWALVNVGDKYVITNKIKNPFVYMTWLFNLSFLLLILVPFIDFYILDWNLMLILAIGSGLYFYGGLPYIKAMQIEEATRINVLWSFIPLFTLILGFIFLGQELSVTQLVAFVILISGGILATIHFKKRTIVLSKAIWYMITACICYSIYAILFSFVLYQVSFVVAFIWLNLFAGFWSFTALLWPSLRRDYFSELKVLKPKLAGIVLGISILDHVGIFFNAWALSLGIVALVFAFEGFQVLFVFVMATMISIFAPKIFREEIDKKNIILKVIALILMIIGILILNLG